MLCHKVEQLFCVVHCLIFVCFCYFLITLNSPSVALRPNAGHGLLILEVSTSHTMRHHSRQDSSESVISASQRPLLDNTQNSQQTDIHAPSGIRTHDLSRRAAVDLRLKERSHWDRQLLDLCCLIFFLCFFAFLLVYCVLLYCFSFPI